MSNSRILISLAALALAASSCSQADDPPNQPRSDPEMRIANDPLDQPLPNPETDFAEIEQLGLSLERTGVSKSDRALLFRWMVDTHQFLIGKALSPDVYVKDGKWPATVREAIEQQRRYEAAEERRVQINRLQTWCGMRVGNDTNGPWYPAGPFELDGKSFDDPCSALSKSSIAPEAVEVVERGRILNERVERESREREEAVEREISERLQAGREESWARQEEDER